MACYHPLKGFLLQGAPEGKGGVVFSATPSRLAQHFGVSENDIQFYQPRPYDFHGQSVMASSIVYRDGVHMRKVDIVDILVPCGQCIGCRLDRARDWALRAYHESLLHDKNCFITLTFDDQHLPLDKSINKRDLQLFFKRLRKAYPHDSIRYLSCGEYGEKLGRPHYHALLFGFDFADKYLLKQQGTFQYYISPSLSKIWPFGFHLIAPLNYQTCSYVARYVTKKVTGEAANEHYNGRTPEFILTSRRPGLGKAYFEKFGDTDLIPRDSVTMESGVEVSLPRYYDKLLEVDDPDLLECLKRRRVARDEAVNGDLSEYERDQRRRASEVIAENRFKRKKRPLESEVVSTSVPLLPTSPAKSGAPAVGRAPTTQEVLPKLAEFVEKYFDGK